MNKLICFVVVFFFFQTHICLNKCDRQVTFTCDGENGSTTRGEPGPPGKRGPIGNPGPVGPIGNAADLTGLEEKINQLNQTLIEIRKRMLPTIYHFQLPATQITWARCKQHCESLNLMLCSRREIFPRDGVMRSIGTQIGNHWAPIRDANNDWVQVGTTQGRAQPGDSHNAIYPAQNWGLQNTNDRWKGHFFCCMQ